MSDRKPGLVRRFFTFTTNLINWVRMIVLNLVFVVMLMFAWFMFTGGAIPSIPERGALIVDIKGSLVDQRSYMDPLSTLMGQANPYEQETLVQDVIDAIDMASDDDRITALVLNLDYMVYGGISKMQEIAVALERFRASGKKVIARGDYFSQDQYFLAAQADEVYMDPMGGVLLTGYGLYRSYFKEALDKLAINFHVFRVGEYKSALEPFMRDDMSEQAKQANLQWLSDLWGQYSETVAQRRQISTAELNRYVDQFDQQLATYQGNTATAAVAAGLVDGLKDREAMNSYLVEQVGASDDEGFYEAIGFETYLWLSQLSQEQTVQNEQVGLIVAVGNIVDGEQPVGTIGGDTVARLIRQARMDDSIAALVLRVDSGGGSAFASEVIRRELLLLQQAGKPLVVSMGSMAASGGYWIAASADEIWATPTTLTGSIGIFGAFPSFEKTLAKVGVHNDGVGTSTMAGALRPDRALEPAAARAVQLSIEHGYRQFLEVVAQGRDMSVEAVNDIAQGRVWSGEQAQRLGLVDQLGGLEEAIAAAADKAELASSDYLLIEVPRTPQEELLSRMGLIMAPVQGSSLVTQVQRLLKPVSQHLAFIAGMNDPRGVYAHCMSCVAP